MFADASMNIGGYLLEVGHPDDIAVIDRDGAHTYDTLRRSTRLLSDHIATWDLEAGSRIGVLSRNSLFWAAAYLAVLRSGHIAVPFATVLTPDDVLAKADFVDCRALLIDTALRGGFYRVIEAMSHVADEEVWLTAGPDANSTEERVAPVASDDDAVLMFTSGTTSAPRAVRVSHGNIRANTDSIIEYLELTAADRMLVVLPFSYCYGASLLHTHLRAGGGVSICDTFAFPETVLEAINRDACTGFAGVPSSYQHLLRASSFSSTPLPTLRTMQQAGGRLPQPQIEQVVRAQPQARLIVMYGSTEATARLSYLPAELQVERRGSIGRGIPGVTLRIVDDAGHPVGPGTVGEVFAEGANITKGYWNDPEGSAAKFVAGGLRTGDLGYADEDGFIYLVDRVADFIKSWGIRISSQEIEDVIVALPGVTAAAAVARPDETAGEAVVVFYSTDGTDISAEQILSHCRSNLARHLVPSEVRYLPRLPLNHNGKILKSDLKELAADSSRKE